MTWLLRLATCALLAVALWPAIARAEQLKSFSYSGEIFRIDTAKDEISARYPLELVASSARQSIERELRVPHFGVRGINLDYFNLYSYDGEDRFRIFIQVTAYTILTNVTCRVNVTEWMRRRPALEFKLEPEVHGDTKCDVSGDIWNDVDKQLTEQLTGSLQRALSVALVDSIPNSADIADDPVLGPLAAKFEIKGGTCKELSKDFLCISTFVPSGTVDAVLALFAAETPAAGGAMTSADKAAVRALRDVLKPLGPVKQSTQIANLSYPAKRTNQEYDDGDMAIFGGLLCASGEASACELVRNAQSATGQVWRSPDKRNHYGEQAQFSGDQTQGVLLYLATTRDAPYLRRWLGFVTANAKPLPEFGYQFGIGYKTCISEGGRSKTCLLGGVEWHWLNYLANKLGVADALPPNADKFDGLYGYNTRFLPITAMTNESGFRLHLVGVQLFLSRRVGIWTADHQQAAEILAARQPRNAFFLYLAQGSSRAAAAAFLSACGPNSGDLQDQWIWERDPNGNPSDWKQSMAWDCVFMANLLLETKRR